MAWTLKDWARDRAADLPTVAHAIGLLGDARQIRRAWSELYVAASMHPGLEPDDLIDLDQQPLDGLEEEPDGETEETDEE